MPNGFGATVHAFDADGELSRGAQAALAEFLAQNVVTMQAFIDQISTPGTAANEAVAAVGGGGGGGTSARLEVFYSDGAYPTQPASRPAGVKVRAFYGPTQYLGPTWPGVIDTYQMVALT